MKVTIDYHEVKEEFLRKEMVWLKEEFEVLFGSKMDKKIANNILDYFMENPYLYDNIILLRILNEAIENIEKSYPNLS